YRRQDAIGTPFCITVDHQSAEDGTVTLRHRDTMEQERVSIDDIERIVTEKCDIKNLLRQLM
ncbi:MAG: glycine--tRNA ligase, partial [Bacteroidales bacterium]|nr:glycine--tRNA ligase [Bacteroidales bacterium]MBQ2351549.1 glycine--tRNA ligase [Bacteroidales bacterium]